MKKFYAVLVLVFCSFVSNAQIVNIPDVNFKNRLLNYEPVIDTNNDGEIQVSEALVVTLLDVHSSFISNMTGIEAFTNLESLNCYYNELTSINLFGLINLKILNCGTDGLNEIDLTGLINLTDLDIGFSNIQTLNLSGLINLKNLNCNDNELTTLNVSEQINLENLNCSHNKLEELNLTGLSQLKYLICEAQSWLFEDNNPDGLSSLILTGTTSLNILWCGYNNLSTLNLDSSINLTELDCSVNNLTSLSTVNLSNLTKLECQRNQINNFNLGALTNLTNLNCSNNSINLLPVDSLTNLKYLHCSNNQIASLEITNLTNLLILECYTNQITDLDLSLLTILYELNCSNNQINNLNASNSRNLINLYCSNNNLTSLNISNLTHLSDFNCSNNNLTELNFPICSHYHYYDGGIPLTSYYRCSNNLFSILDFSPISCNHASIYVDNNPNLNFINIKNSQTWYLLRNMENCPNLNFICINSFDEDYLFGEVSVFGDMDPSLLANIELNTYCSFNPGGNYNTISGTFTFDNDNNGCDDNDFKFPNRKIKINDISNIFGATFTTANGNYNFFTQAGNFIITPAIENPYFTVSPTSATITFADSNNNTQTQNFCVTPNGVHNDVEVSVLPVQRPRPGFDATYQMVYKNKGNQVLSGNVNLAFNDAVLDFVLANPAVSAQSLNTLSWSYSNLLPFESRTINFTLNVNSPQEIPAVNNGDVLSFSASIDPIAGDETVNDNTFALTQIVLGSYDPNDKTCLEGNTIVPERIGEYLHYLIRFQNSGTAAAENIVVKDIIDTTKFDITSLQLTAASHNYTTKITGNKVEFIFENIQLPAEIDDEAGSNGFIAFKIKTKNNLTVGNSVSNKADIYFDYNFPITTNEATTTFATLGVNQIENKSVAVFPNPVNDVLTITSKGALTSIQLLDVQGRLIATYLESEEKATINLSDKASGVYFVKIFTEKGVKLEKIVKK